MGLKFKSTSLIPPGGWFFIEADGTKVQSHSPQDLIIAVAKYRGKNGINPGDPTEEVTAQLCHRWPQGCFGYPSRYIPAPVDWLPGAKKFLATIKRIAKSGSELVSDEIADDRASICVECPYNVPSYQIRGGCRSCGKTMFNELADGAIALLRRAVIKTKKTTYDEKLKACGRCSCDLKFKVWLPMDVINETPEERKIYPSYCWMS